MDPAVSYAHVHHLQYLQTVEVYPKTKSDPSRTFRRATPSNTNACNAASSLFGPRSPATTILSYLPLGQRDFACVRQSLSFLTLGHLTVRACTNKKPSSREANLCDLRLNRCSFDLSRDDRIDFVFYDPEFLRIHFLQV